MESREAMMEASTVRRCSSSQLAKQLIGYLQVETVPQPKDYNWLRTTGASAFTGIGCAEHLTLAMTTLCIYRKLLEDSGSSSKTVGKDCRPFSTNEL